MDPVFNSAAGITPAHEPVDAVFRAMFLMALDAMVLTNDYGDFLDANPAAATLFGISRSQLLQCNALDLGANRVERAQQWEEFLHQGFQRGELLLPNPGGAPRVLEYSSTANLDHGRHLLILRDVSEHRANDRRKDEFLAMLAHELRTPLAPILAAMETMRGRLPDASLSRARDIVERQARHMARLVDDLLDVSRITRGTIDLRRRSVRLRPILEQAIQTVLPLVESRGQRLRVFWPSEECWLYADPTRLDQIIANLLHNASKFTPPGGSIQLRAYEERGELGISVKDSGVGIPPDMLGRVFELFFQATPSLDRSQGGLGLGLTLVQKLVCMHGGMVSARSNGPGTGTEFLVQLPVVRPEHDPPADGAATMNKSPAPLRVLIAEDQADTRAMMCELLELWGHTVYAAAEGDGAVSTALELQPHIALVDIGLPGVDGYEVARRIRAAERSVPHPPIFLVALTGYGQPGDRLHALQAGFDEHRVKPLEVEELRALLARVATLQHLGRSSTSTP